MCRIAYIPKPKDINPAFLKNFFTFLDKKNGGDGIGIGGFVRGEPKVFKNHEGDVNDFVKIIKENDWDNGVLFHCRAASEGIINDDNCHPFIYGESITCHNGHVSAIPAIKLVLLENGTFSKEKIISMTDSEVIAYYINKHGFEISTIFGGTILTMYKDVVQAMVSGDLEYVKKGNIYIYASEFPYEMGILCDEWKIFVGGNSILTDEGPFIVGGGLIGAKEWYDERKKNKNEICYIG